VFGAIVETLQTVQSLDHDRVLRRMALLVRALKRTNFYQTGPDGGPSPTSPSRSPAASWTTCPRPSPSARSSSGRRTSRACTCASARSPGRPALERPARRLPHEVLGLVKAQQVKNA
jgi:glutamate dehydrogenase